jgi:hypothetical protein
MDACTCGMPGWEPKRAILFCEFPACVLGFSVQSCRRISSRWFASLYDPSHPTSTFVSFNSLLLFYSLAYEPWSVINLEAAGTTGRETLFQATFKEMINSEAYSHIPWFVHSSPRIEEFWSRHQDLIRGSSIELASLSPKITAIVQHGGYPAQCVRSAAEK